jgi:hypothetical protein
VALAALRGHLAFGDWPKLLTPGDRRIEHFLWNNAGIDGAFDEWNQFGIVVRSHHTHSILGILELQT